MFFQTNLQHCHVNQPHWQHTSTAQPHCYQLSWLFFMFTHFVIKWVSICHSIAQNNAKFHPKWCSGSTKPNTAKYTWISIKAIINIKTVLPLHQLFKKNQNNTPIFFKLQTQKKPFVTPSTQWQTPNKFDLSLKINDR